MTAVMPISDFRHVGYQWHQLIKLMSSQWSSVGRPSRILAFSDLELRTFDSRLSVNL